MSHIATDIRLPAFHEAGHAVVGHYLGFRIEAIAVLQGGEALLPDGRQYGHTEYSSPRPRSYRAYIKIRGRDEYRSRDPWELPQVRRELMMLAAGHAAVSLHGTYTGTAIPETGANGDFERSVKLLAEYGVDAAVAVVEINRLVSPTLRLVIRLYPDILELADLLVQKQRLTGVEVARQLPSQTARPAPRRASLCSQPARASRDFPSASLPAPPGRPAPDTPERRFPVPGR
jgi:hypothetical protein